MQIIDQAKRLGISRSHWWAVKARKVQPGTSLAVRIFDLTGSKYGILQGLDDAAIDEIRKNTTQSKIGARGHTKS